MSFDEWWASMACLLPPEAKPDARVGWLAAKADVASLVSDKAAEFLSSIDACIRVDEEEHRQ